MSWEFKPVFDSGHRAALAGGKNFVYVCPPAWWAVLPLFSHFPPSGDPGHRTLVLTTPALGITEAAQTIRSLAGMGTVHAATGLARTARMLGSSSISTLISTPADVLALLQRSALQLDGMSRIVIAWPEMMIEEGSADELDAVLSEASQVQRIVVTADARRVSDFLERHARRTPLVKADTAEREPAVSIRYAVADFFSLDATVRAALDVINPSSALVWDPNPGAQERWQEYATGPAGTRVVSDPGSDPVDLAIAAQLPSAQALAALDEVAREVLAIVRAAQLPYLRSIVEKARALQLPSDVDRARDKAARLREDVRDLVERSRGSSELLALAPLFDAYDPATVAAALASERGATDDVTLRDRQVPTWVRLHANVGRQDGVSTGDIVGAILNASGVSKRQVGKIELRDRFALIEVRTEIAQQVLRSLDGVVLKGKKVTARIDRR